ncbi:sugar phosphate isomerase/epimerase, partial [Candidatus Nomurabacteria bacterium]|nr:sugar phosphate isomerase/epimerase [Candidatus Nomurabacteria bacterium]
SHPVIEVETLEGALQSISALEERGYI